MGALDELLAKWRDNPDAGTTLALCTYLGSSGREELVREVGTTSEAWHKDDPQVMFAVGRMFLDAALYQEAQAALVVAGKLSGTDPKPYRYLGEVLLRRGDATRAEKVLGRALQLGATDAETRLWHERATVYLALQARVGMRAVADEVDRTIPRKTSIPPPSMVAPAPAAVKARAPVPSTVPPPPRLVPAATPAPSSSYRGSAGSESEVQTGRYSLPAEQISRSELDTMVMPEQAGGAPAAPPRLAPAPVPVVAAAVPRGRPTAATIDLDADDEPLASPEVVLEHLARVGIYDRSGGAQPAWVAPPRDRTRGTWLFAVAIVVACGAGYGAFAAVRHVRAERAATARSLEAEVAKLLASPRPADIASTDGKLSQVFELDSRSEQAALLWLENRVLSALALPGEPRGIETALARCRTLGIDESRTVFGKVASFLAEGDLAGAAAFLPKWDDRAAEDPFYQFAAAAMLERAGDVRAIGRYQQALTLSPGLSLARVFHAALATVELGPAVGRPLVEEAGKTLGDVPATRALRGLVWALAPADADVPDSAIVPEAERAELPVPLLAIPLLVDARKAARADRRADAVALLDRALLATATPAMASAVGQLALDLGDEVLARKAALRALSYSAIYPRARALAARVALLGGHLAEARTAIQELDAKSPEGRVVRAAAAYEAMDFAELESATEGMDAAEPVASALSVGAGVAMGRSYPDDAALEQMASPGVPWGEIVAVDAALDAGKLDVARKVVGRWGERAGTPVYALRAARLARYDGKAPEAVTASEAAVVPGGVTPRVLVERYLCLAAARDEKAARELLAQYPAVLGPMTDYLKVDVDVLGGKLPRAKAQAARLEPAPEGSPLLYDIIAARALAGVADRRAKPLVQGLLKRAPHHPDVVQLGRTVGLVR